MSGSTNKYTKDELMRFNVYRLRQIPEGKTYETLRKFVSDERTVNLSTIVKQTIIPTYLKNRYGDITVGNNNISRGNYHEKPKEPARRKIYVQKIDTVADKINEEIRDLLSKLSDMNKDKILAEFMKKDIPDECGQALINTIYGFAVDLSYLIHLYAEIIFKLKDKNQSLYQLMMDKIITSACEPLVGGDASMKRLKMGNIILIAEIYQKRPDILTNQELEKVVDFMINKSKSTESIKDDYLQMVCELLKKISPVLKKSNPALSEKIIGQLKDISHDQQYDKRYRFMVQDLVDQYNEDDEDDD